MVTITYRGTEYEFNFEELNMSVHDTNDLTVLTQVGAVLEADLTRGYQVLRVDDKINLVPHATYG